MSGNEPAGPVSDLAEARRRKAAGTRVGSLVFVMFLLFLILFDAQAAHQHRWTHFAGITVFTLALMTIPTGGARWLRRSVHGWKTPASS